MRVAAPLALRPGDEEELRKMASARSGPAALARRARVVLLAAGGLPNTVIVERAGLSLPSVRHWRARYASGGIGALGDAPRSGRPRTVDEIEIVVRTLEPPPGRLGVTHWSSRLLARELGISTASIIEVWRSYGLQPWRTETFKFSTDPELEARVRDVVGLYLSPPEGAVVLSIDEKPQCQALQRSQPILPLRPGIPAQMTHDYIRHGVTCLFAALEVATGKVLDACYPRHRHSEFLKFLKKVATAYPGQDLHVVLDNYGTHKHPRVREWLEKNPRIQLHFTPTGCSWLNMVEIFFGIITRQAIRRGSFTSVHELTAAIVRFIDGWNQRCEPFSWTKDADEIIAKIKRKEIYCARHLASIHGVNSGAMGRVDAEGAL